ncbi:hypothetical protein VU07_02755 [Desulfobulbus sp. F4]|nr:hypothetical protein [Desulfobulbus sp. F4]
MLLQYHRQYTGNALKRLQLDDKDKQEILVGCTANDLCEFTSDMQIVLDSKDAFYQSFGTKPSIFLPMALFQSHFGNLASLHAMAKKAQESPEITMNEITLWFEFLNGIALGTISFSPEARIYENKVPVRSLFARCKKIEYWQIFDSRDISEIRKRAVGMMCHLIQDVFTFSHCERNSNSEIVKFYYYPLQDMEKHKKGDCAADGLAVELAKQCLLCVESITKNIAYDCAPILILSKNAQKSDGGSFA